MSDPYAKQLSALHASIQSFATGIKNNFVRNSDLVNATDYDIPYFTGSIVDGRELWGVIIDFGTLPNQSTKAYLIAQNILDEWAPVGERWIDTGNSFFFNPTTGETAPLPHTSELGFQGGNVTGSQVAIYLSNTEIIMHTQSDRTDFQAVVVLKYLKLPQP